ncbi:MAG: hypothetical protein ABUT20_11025 [Bacteroidota bacterium]
MKEKIKACIAGLLFFCSLAGYTQCPQRPDELPASCGTGIPLVDGANVNTGEEHYVAGGSLTVSNVNLNGGTIKVCTDGILTIQNINFNSGRIVNLNTLNITTNIALQGSNFSIFNGPNALLDMTNNDMIINSEFVNLGKAIFSNVTVNGSAGICLGNGSITETVNLTSNPANAVAVPTGNACFRYNGNALLNAAFTGSTGLFVCQGSLASAPFPSDFGAATVTTNCPSCESLLALPVELSDFSAFFRNGSVYLKWITASETNNDHFVIERSSDGLSYTFAGQVSATGNTVTNTSYQFEDHPPILSTKYFYRIKQVDKDGKHSYSPVVRINTGDKNIFGASVVPNPAGAIMNLVIEGVKENESLLFEMMNAQGSRVYSQQIRASGMTIVAIQRPALSAGLYFYRITRMLSREMTNGKVMLR